MEFIMKNKIAVICPTRNRPDNADAVVKSWKETNDNKSVVVFGLDDDNHSLYENWDSMAVYDINPRLKMIGTLNLLARKYAKTHRYIGFIGDDHRFRTPHWDTTIYNELQRIGPNAIVYGDDLIQGPLLPTAVFLDAQIVNKLGYMAPPTLTHMYADNFWLDIGNALGTLSYLDYVVIEHCHHVVGKAVHDKFYDEVDEYTAPDRIAYGIYHELQFAEDLKKLNG